MKVTYHGGRETHVLFAQKMHAPVLNDCHMYLRRGDESMTCRWPFFAPLLGLFHSSHEMNANFQNDPKYVGYLTSEQALADFAALVRHLKSSLPKAEARYFLFCFGIAE